MTNRALNLFKSQPRVTGGLTNTSFSTEPTEITPINAWNFFHDDHTPIRFKNGHSLSGNFEYAWAIPFDIDNDDSNLPEEWDNPANWTLPHEISRRLKEFGINYWMVASRNHWIPKTKDNVVREARPKFHVYLPLSQPLYDSDKFVRFCEWCIRTFNSDVQVKSRAQKIFGHGGNFNTLLDNWNEGRCVDEVLGDDDLPAAVQKTQVIPISLTTKGGNDFDWFAAGEWRNHLTDLEVHGWDFFERDGVVYFQTPDGDHEPGKHDGNIKDCILCTDSIERLH